MKHAAYVALVLLYVVVWGQNWTTYAAALMIAVIIKDFRKEKRSES